MIRDDWRVESEGWTLTTRRGCCDAGKGKVFHSLSQSGSADPGLFAVQENELSTREAA